MSVEFDKLAIQEAIVANFAVLLGSRSGRSLTGGTVAPKIDGDVKTASAKDFEECLSGAVSGNDVVCTIPSLDLKSGSDDPTKGALPKVGEHSRKLSSNSKVPMMAASVLNNTGATEASAEASELEQKAAKNLQTLTSWTKSTLEYAPGALSKNLSASFTSLVNSRIRAWTLLLLRHSLTTGDNASRSRLLNMLSSSIEVKSVSTCFKTLPLPETARLQPKEADVILPLLLEAVLHVTVQGKNDVVPLRAPGTISGNFASGAGAGLVKVDVRLDTSALLESMVEQARLVVFKAVARATKVAGADKRLATRGVSPRETASSLSGFSSALNLSSEMTSQSPRLKKAQVSALRLNSILQGNDKTGGSAAGTNSLATINRDIQGNPLSKTRKTRSVQWDHPLDVPSRDQNSFPDAKRQRMAQSQARLRSFKSFGRPHGGGDGSGPRNATFGTFGRTGAPTWGKDGKLLNHPQPGGETMSSRLSSLAVEPGQKSNQNATFDLLSAARNSRRAPLSSASALAGAQLLGHRTSGSGLSRTLSLTRGPSMNRSLGGGLPSTLPRTATALESWLVNSTTK